MDNDSTNQPQGNASFVPPAQPGQPPQPGMQAAPDAVPQSPQPAAQPQGTPQSQRAPLRIDHNLLAELGLAALPEEEKKALEKHIYETLEMRVGMRLADQMTNEQLDEFETYFNARDDAGAFRWLETNFPNYKDIVADEFAKLKTEVASQAPAILAASQQGAQTTPSQSAPQSVTDVSPAPQPSTQQPSMSPPPQSGSAVPTEWPTSPGVDQQLPPQQPPTSQPPVQ